MGIVQQFAEVIRVAAVSGTPLCIRGSGTKDFFGGPRMGDLFDVSACQGIVDYEPAELVISARAGTPLAEIESVLHERGQMLAFEPPHFGTTATLGGCIACGLSGPRRAQTGAVRDFVLGIRLLDGRGNELCFGGRVMKNVAGFDVSRLLAGSLGTLGVILEVSLKVLPLPVIETTLRFEKTPAEGIALMNTWAGRALPISATCQDNNFLTVRLSGATAAVRAACAQLGGEVLDEGLSFWRQLREHTLDFFRTPLPLWRVSLRSTAPPLELAGTQLIEWNGALRWVVSEEEPHVVRHAANSGGGHAVLFRSQNKPPHVFPPLPASVMRIHRELKRAFDPMGILNPGRLYPEF